MRTPQFNQTQSQHIALEGGWDLNTPVLQVPPGRVREALNYEQDINGGYTRIVGYERFDGRPLPSDATYTVLPCAISGAYALGNTVTGATSAATGVLIAVDDTVGSDDSFIVTKVTGAFSDSENLTIGGTVRATMNGAAAQNGAPSNLLDAQYANLAADIYRADIAAIPGSGPVRGIARLAGVAYGFRNNAGGTAADLYKSSALGWVQVPLGFEVSFTAGNVAIAEGTVVTGATSGATATLKRQVLQSGAYAGSTGAGRLIFTTVTGTFSAAENLQTGGVTRAVCGGAQAAITLAAGGKFEFVKANLGGGTATNRLYGCDGVSRGFEFDGTIFVPIVTGMTADTPTHVVVHKNHLFFAFASSAQHSGPGTPYMWTLIAGAGELAAGDTITGFDSQPGSQDTAALAIFTRNTVNILYGSSSSSWNLTTYQNEIGAIEWSVQNVGTTLMLDDRGLTTLLTTTSYGNFQHATLTHHIQSWINAQRLKVKASCVCRDKNQYRLFFSDKYALYVTFKGNKLRAVMPVLFFHTVNVTWSGEGTDGAEEMFYGSNDDGFVYQLDRGTSFDGEDIDHYLHLQFNNLNSPRLLKRFKRAVFLVKGLGYSTFFASAEIGWGSAEIEQAADALVTSFSSVFWDSIDWDNFVWDGRTLLPSECPLDGTAENISLKMSGSSDYHEPLTFTGILLDYSMRRRLR